MLKLKIKRPVRLFYSYSCGLLSNRQAGQPVTPDSCISLIKNSNFLLTLKTIHASMLRSHLHLNIFFFTSLINQYTLLGSISYAYSLFSIANSIDIFLWNVIIRGLVDHAHYRECLLLYRRMIKLGIKPNNYTFPFVIKACGCLSDLGFGKQVHRDVVAYGFELDSFTASSLIAMYGKCGTFELPRKLFDKMPERTVICWNAMIGACFSNQRYDDGEILFWRMLDEGFRPGRAAILNVMGCVRREIDADKICRVAVDNGFDLDQLVQNAAMGMYSKCGRVDLARGIFDGISDKDIVTWSNMIEAYSQADLPLQSLALFKHMMLQNIVPDSVTLLSVIRACTILASLRRAHAAHNMVIVTGGFFNNQITVETAAIDLYVKCGSLTYARKVFDRMQERNVISWSTIISGYGMHGHGREAYNLFNEMKASIKPDHIAFVSILSACSHSGLIAEGWECFKSMTPEFGVIPRTEHYACMVDLLGRAGKLSEALDFINRMPISPDTGVWGSLLGASRIHSNVEMAEMAAEALFKLDKWNAGRYVLLSNIYLSRGKTQDADRIRALMKNRGARKISGHTTIEMKDKVYTFVAGDRSHPQTDLIYSELERVMDRIRQEGYTPDINFVLHDVEEETKEKMLYAHSEKLAIVFGLLNSKPNSVIRITKNLRICGDCHTATKFITKVTRREIIVRDARRFHHFKDGTCTCGDYW
ncbi:pentatricopeptide repeat-containing protein At3g26782, mitochondrial-like [Mercurialis annua]|uniref:pentatricopeptide repeat-containing protein At3g26782, mitochondrial-like n=1 Tax=Mercurialis annua TaxID=3986 RepID=UPI002160AA0B|nr:pentatricopeptide repeat-containing protein At3g26782, mitochondrial-like [Mercurialis annua]